MRSDFSTVFDLIESPERIQLAYWFYAVFILAGIVLILLTVAGWKWKWRRRWSLSVFTAIWATLVPYLILDDARDVAATRRMVERGLSG